MFVLATVRLGPGRCEATLFADVPAIDAEVPGQTPRFVPGAARSIAGLSIHGALALTGSFMLCTMYP